MQPGELRGRATTNWFVIVLILDDFTISCRAKASEVSTADARTAISDLLLSKGDLVVKTQRLTREGE